MRILEMRYRTGAAVLSRFKVAMVPRLDGAPRPGLVLLESGQVPTTKRGTMLCMYGRVAPKGAK